MRLCFCASFAINQHGDAGVLARAAMGADLNSLEGVIRHTKRTILYFHPLDDPAPIKRVWCLYEILTVATTEGNELTLGFSSSGKKEMYKIAAAFAQNLGTSAAAAKDVLVLAKQPSMSQKPGHRTPCTHTTARAHTGLSAHTGSCKRPLRSLIRRRRRRQCLPMQT